MLAEPFRWLLLDEYPEQAEATAPAVGIAHEPLATARTLTEAKREAELIAASRTRTEVQKRQVLALLISLGVALLIVGAPVSGGELPLLVAGIVAVRSTTILLGTLIPAAFGSSHEVFYQ